MKRTQISRRPTQHKLEFDADYAAVLPSVLLRGCEFVKYVIVAKVFIDQEPDCIPKGYNPVCSGPLRGHHARGRRVKDANDPENLRCLCDQHHAFVHANPRWSREVGLMISRVA